MSRDSWKRDTRDRPYLMKKAFTGMGAGLLAFAPMAAFAQVVSTGSNIFTLANIFGGLIRVVMPMLIGLAVLLVIVQGIRMIVSDGELKDEMKEKFVKSIVGLFLILGAFGIVAFISSSLGIGIAGNIDATKQIQVEF